MFPLFPRGKFLAEVTHAKYFCVHEQGLAGRLGKPGAIWCSSCRML